MGNQNHTQDAQGKPDLAAEFGGIFIQLNTAVVITGETLSGYIYMDLKKSYPSDALRMKFKGTERVHWIDSERRTRSGADGNTEVYYVDVDRNGNRAIVDETLHIYKWKQGEIIPPGHYSFPFSFKIPDGLPGTIHLHKPRADADIDYTMEAYLEPQGSNPPPKISYTSKMILREPFKKEIKDAKESLEHKFKTCCCCNQGIFKLASHYEKNAYAPGEEVRISSDVDNSRCKLKIKNVYFELEQVVNFYDGRHKSVKTFPVVRVNLGTILPGESWTNEKRKVAHFKLPPLDEGIVVENHQSPDGNPKAGDDQQPIISDSTITPSTNGLLVSSNYVLNVALEGVEGCMCCRALPYTSIPIEVYSPNLKQPEMQAPIGWKPVEMPVYNIAIVIEQPPKANLNIQNSGFNSPMPNYNQQIQQMNSQQMPTKTGYQL
jgi:sporulation-control protein spo0M